MYAVMSLFLGFTYYDAGALNQRGIPDMIMSILWTIAFFSFTRVCDKSSSLYPDSRDCDHEITNGRYTLAEYIISSLRLLNVRQHFFVDLSRQRARFGSLVKPQV